jgi:hypothetical protein
VRQWVFLVDGNKQQITAIEEHAKARTRHLDLTGTDKAPGRDGRSPPG